MSLKWSRFAAVIAAVAWVATSTVAMAGMDDEEEGEKESSAEVEKKPRETYYQVDVKYRRLSVPDAVVDVFYQQHEHVSGDAIAADLVIVKNTGFNMIVHGDYSTAKADKDGPWQEKGDNADVDWTQVDLQFYSVDFTVAYEMKLLRLGPVFTGSLIFGTGLGVGYVTGDIITYDDPTGPTGARKEESYPNIFPVLNVQVGARALLFNHLVAQVDVGFRNALYGGLAAGVRF